MWWDWTQITLWDSVLFSLLTLAALYFIGFGSLKLVSWLGKSSILGSFDFLQKVNVRIFFGLAIVVFLVGVLSWFSIPVLFSSLVVIGLGVVGFIVGFRDFRQSIVLDVSRLKRNSYVFLVFVVLFAVVFLSSRLLVGYFGSTNDDAALHTLITRVILDNPSALWSRSSLPYGNFILDYPSGAHVFSAFSVTVFGVAIQKAIIMLTAILPCLIALSFYSTIKSIFKSKVAAVLGLVISAFFAIGSSWAPLYWGGLPVMLSLYVTISIMGFVFVLFSDQMTVVKAVLLGFLFYFASQIYPDALLLTFVWTLLVLAVTFFPMIRRFNWRLSWLFTRRNAAILIAFLVPVLFSVPYFYSLYVHHVVGIQFSQLGAETGSIAQDIQNRISFNWLIDFPAFSSFFSTFGRLLTLTPYSLILLILLFVPPLFQRVALSFPVLSFRRGLFLVYLFLMVVMGYLGVTIFARINFLTALINPERVWQHLFIPGVILTAAIIFSVGCFTFLLLKRLLTGDVRVSVGRLRVNRLFGVVLLVFIIVGVELVSVPLYYDAEWQYNRVGSSFGFYETLDSDDLELMSWIRDNLAVDSKILVSSGDSGQYVMAVTGHQTVCFHSYVENYTDVMELLTSNASDVRAVPLLIQQDIAYVYIGSIATAYEQTLSYYKPFNASQFLSSPNFTLTKKVGEAYIFRFDSSMALLSDV